jgi:Glycosyltransferase family 92
VSLVSNPCDNAENNLEIINNKPPNGVKKKFGVCTKQMDYDNRDFAKRFIEWVEMLKILGVDKIHGYNRHVSKDLFKAMTYYEEEGILDINPFLEPFGTVYKLHDWPMRSIERNLLNDCFYRNKNLYEYIAIIDPDEFFMPLIHENWHDLLSNLKNKENQDYFYFSYVWFVHNTSIKDINGIPSHFYMLQHIQVIIFLRF